MYEELFTKIQATLANVTQIKDYFFVPQDQLTKFPCVFFKPFGLQNSFETQNENSAVYRFLMIVMVGASGTTIENAFGTVLPGAVDALISQFNTDWDKGTIDGHRVRVKIDSADEWQVSEEKEGAIAYAPLYLEFRLLTSN